MVASANYVTYLQAHDKGTLDIRIVAEAIRAAPRMMDVLVPEDSDIKTVADLKGKKLAVNVLNNVQSLTFDEILEKQGVGRPDYRAIPFPQMGAALDTGQVDAVHAVEPYDSAIQDELKARVLIDGSSAPVESIPLASCWRSTAPTARRSSSSPMTSTRASTWATASSSWTCRSNFPAPGTRSRPEASRSSSH